MKLWFLVAGMVLCLAACQSVQQRGRRDSSEVHPTASAGPTVVDARRVQTRTLRRTQPGGTRTMAEVRPPPGWMALHLVDVGQGDATLLEFPCGTALVDAGGEDGDNERFRAYLDRFYSARPERQRFVDAVYLSHSHDDHNRGIVVLQGPAPYGVGAVIDSGKDLDGGAARQAAFRTWVRQNGGKARSVLTKTIEYTDGLTDETIDPISGCSDGDVDPVIRVVSGGWDYDTGPFKKANDHSLVVRVDWGKVSFLFTGDLEDVQGKGGIPEMLHYYMQDRSILDADVWKVRHHGSHNGISEELMRAMTPRIALIGMGNADTSAKARGYGHPRDVAFHMLTDREIGLSCRRAHQVVEVFEDRHGARHPEHLDHALFGTGWDGDVVILAHPDGRLAAYVTGSPDDQLEQCN